jgi:UDP-2,3-diacylglucosamine pyrophosphatase LpxH
MVNEVVVISDLHIGSDKIDDFDPDIERCFVDFISALMAKGLGVELVINGDFLDFVQASPYKDPDLENETSSGIPLCFTEIQSQAKLNNIAAKHPEVFNALHAFLANDKANRLVILPGNHDADFFFSGVRDLCGSLVCKNIPELSARLSFHLRSVYRPAACPWAWIEHGHQYDRVNSFFLGEQACWNSNNLPILKDKYGTPRLLECVGTRFLNRFLNDLDEKYPLVDNVKPFSRFLRVFGASALTPGTGPIKAALAVYSMLTFLTKTARANPTDLLSAAAEREGMLEDCFTAMFNSLSPADRKQFIDAATARGYVFSRPLQMVIADRDEFLALLQFLENHIDLLDGFQTDDVFLSAGEEGTLELAKGYTVNETQELYRAAERIIETDPTVKMVTMGHTHEPVRQAIQGRYINTGSWTRYYQFDNKDKTRPWSMLKEDSYRAFPYELNYLALTPESSAPFELSTFKMRANDTC